MNIASNFASLPSMAEPSGILQASRLTVKAELTTAAAARFSRPGLSGGVFSNRRMSLEKSLDGGGGSSFQV
jgi:hypothetical protein